MGEVEIRDSRAGDLQSIEKLYRDVFPDEDLLPVVHELLEIASGVLSLVAIDDGVLSGHGVFAACTIVETNDAAALLGPLAVVPTRQRQGIGRKIIDAGLQRLRADGVNLVYVLGDPDYYGRSGFAPEWGITPPYALPEEWRDAWQSINLGDVPSSGAGMLSVPEPWRQPALWAP
ncbi:MAG: N-acetyltransferase [Proteobacteria bacterium]|nr:N-acetyltransferase [Pseudomonadota bacterium]